MAQALEFIRGRGWKVSAIVVGVLAVGVGFATASILDSEGVLPAWGSAIAFIRVVTVLLIPRSELTRRPPPQVPHE